MSYFGEQNQGNEKSNSSSSSSRRGKKSSNSNKTKQPQRGLGVAQLEKIRLQSQYGASYLPSPHGPFYPNNLTQENMRMQEAYSSTPTPSPFSYNFHGNQNVTMGMRELERGNVGYGNSQTIAAPSWILGNGILETQQFAQPSITRHFMNQQVEDAQKRMKEPLGGSSSQNSETSETQELDLELRL